MERALEMEIRKAEIDDFTGVFELVKALWDYNEYEYNKTFVIYSKIIVAENTFAYVVVDAAEIVGFCHGDFFQTLWMCGMTCYLSGIITRSDHRRKGVGKLMMNHVKANAHDYGCKAMILDSGIPRSGAHEFYQKYGFEKSCYGFEMAI